MRIVLCWLLLVIAVSAAEVSVLDHSAVPDDGQDDTAAFRAAVQQGGIVRVPSGVYNLTVSGQTAVDCPRSVQLVGEGQDLSVLQAEDKLTAPGSMILFRPNTRGTVKGLSLIGPKDIGEFGTNAIVHYGGPGGSLRVENCLVTSGGTAVKLEELDGKQDRPTVLITDSELAARSCILAYNSGRVDCLRTEFRDYGVPDSNQYHAMYVYLPVSVLVDRCVFHGNLGRGLEVHPYSPKVPGKGSVTIEDCEFRPAADGQGILTHAETLTVIRGCRLGATAVLVRKGGAVISESSLRDRQQVRGYASEPGPGSWILRDCRFGE